MTTAAIYVRQSRHKTYERSVSPEIQEESCRALPAVKACDRVDTFVDLDLSGGSVKKRHGYQALLARIEATDATHEPLVVAFYDQTRISRDNLDSARFYAALEVRPWVAVAVADGTFDRSPTGEANWAVAAAFATQFRKQTGEKIRAAYRYRNAQGAPTGPVAFGYRRFGSRADGVVKVEARRAAVVRSMFELYATGTYSVRTLAERLNAEGAAAPGPRGWMPDTVADVLQNVAYVGKTYSVSRRRREGKIIPAQWPAIVDDALFEKVRARLFRNVRIGAVRATREFAFRGLLFCDACDGRLRASCDHGTVYYRCRRDVVDACGSAGIREEKLLPWADRLFSALNPMRLEWLNKRMAAAPAPSAKGLKAVDSQLERAKRLFVLGDFSEGEYTRERNRLQALRDEYSRQIAASGPVELAGVSERWRAGSPAERRALLLELFDRLHVQNGHIVGMTPRPDRVNRVTLLVEYALGPEMAGTVDADVGLPEGGPAELADASVRSSMGSGEGGI